MKEFEKGPKPAPAPPPTRALGRSLEPRPESQGLTPGKPPLTAPRLGQSTRGRGGHGDMGTWGHCLRATCLPEAGRPGPHGPAPGAGVRARRGRRVRDRGGLHSVDTVSLRRARARLSLRGPARPGACAPEPATALLGPSLSAWASDSLQGQVQRVGRTRAAGETPHSTERAGPAGRRLLQGARRAASELAACA